MPVATNVNEYESTKATGLLNTVYNYRIQLKFICVGATSTL